MSIAKRLLWQLRLKTNGNVLEKLAALRHAQELDEAGVASLQHERLEKLLSHAYKHVPYYQKLFDEYGTVENGKVKLENFSKLPLLSKDELREQGNALRSLDLGARSWRENTSGGSTGEPVRFVQDEIYHEWMLATKLLFDEWTGYHLGDRKVVIWGSERDLLVGKETTKTYFGRYLRNEVMLNSFRMAPEDMRRYIQTINSFRPKQILAYVESIFELARFVEREGLEVHSPAAIMTSAGTLHDDIRQTLERVFRAPVFNRYGSREVGDVACNYIDSTRLYISPTQYVEVLDEDGSLTAPGEVGEIVITQLHNYAMPLIRYRIGDLAVVAEDEQTQGLAWPALKSVTGRVTDTFYTKSGAQVYGEYFTHLFYFKDWVRKFQVVQETLEHIHIKLVPRTSDNFQIAALQPELDEIKRDIKVVMGECHVTYEIVEDIPPTPSGKYRYTLSKVTQNAHHRIFVEVST